MDMACVAALVGVVGVSLQAHAQPDRATTAVPTSRAVKRWRSSIPPPIRWLQPLHPVVVAGMGKSTASCQKE